MSTNSKDQEDKFLLCFADILSLFRRAKFKILACALGVGALGAFCALLMPIRYQAEGTFREKGVRSNNFSTSVLQLLGGGSPVGGESEAASLMTSRKILKDVVDNLHLQAHLTAISDIETTPKLIKNNLMIAWASTFSSSPKPVLKDFCCPLKVDALQFTGEIPRVLWIDLQEDGKYEAFDLLNSKASMGWGKLGEPFQLEDLSVTLVSSDSAQPIKAQAFSLVVNSLENTVKQLCSILKVEPTKLDKSLLALKCEHRNRHQASEIVNAVMDSYQNYLKNYHTEVALSQLDYLSQRRDQLRTNLVSLMQKHADNLATDLYDSGFIESEKEMEFLAKNQHEYKRKLLDNELEIKRLKNIQPGNLAYYNRYSQNEGDPTIINSILSEMRDLKQTRDSLEIELQKKALFQSANIQQSFEIQLNELKEVQEYLAEVKEIVSQYEQGYLPNLNSKLVNDSRFLLKGWIERLQHAAQEHPNNWKVTNENFKFYLNNLERLFGVHERILQERLTHQQNPSGEYQGISLEMATNLYLDYSRQLIQMEGTIRQNLFFINQIEDPNFEVSSLSSGLTDPISMAMIHKASELILNLRDENNQSIREQERIKSELQLQRTFLTMHLKQMVQLMELNKQLINEKVFALQTVSLELVHQRVSLLEKNLQDYLKARLDNLQQERNLIKRQLENIHGEMALLPKKWVSEKLVTQEVDVNRRIVEEIVKLVESKNISHKLEVIQSAPVDPAISPVHPLRPKVILWGIIGFILGGFMGSSLILARTLSKGLRVSLQNLEIIGYHIAGELKSGSSPKFQEANFATLRRLQAYFDRLPQKEDASASKNGQILLLVEGQGPRYANDLADLLMKKGRRVLTLDLNFKESKTHPSTGLLQYLQGEIATPPIQASAHGDWIAAGGTSSFAIELLGSPSFQKLLEQLKQRYDWILAITPALPCSVETESLLNLFPNAAVTLKEERTADLNVFNHFLDQGSRLSFMIDTN